QRNIQLIEPLGRHRQADQAPSVTRHEVDGFRRDLLRGNREVAFVLAILVVADDDDAAGADGGDGIFNRRERTVRLARAFRDPHPPRRCRVLLQCVTSPGCTALKFSPASSAARTTYLPTMSHSRFTGSLTCA